MLQFLILATLAALVAGAEPDSQPAAVNIAKLYDGDDRMDFEKDQQGPIVARTFLNDHSGHRPDIAAQDKIIKDTFSPTYYEPLWILDYRFLKTNGRKYVRGPGGQVLILPRSYQGDKHDNARDYDSLIEHLRLKIIAEQNQRHDEDRGLKDHPGDRRAYH